MTLNALSHFQISQSTKSITCNLRYLILTLAQAPHTYKVLAICTSNLQHLTMINKKIMGTLELSHILIINTININYSSSLQSSILNNN